MENLQIIDDYDFKDLNQAFAAVNWYKRFELTKRGSYHFDLKKLKLNYWYKSWKEVCDDLGKKRGCRPFLLTKIGYGATMSMKWQEQDHPRDNDGKFTDKGTGTPKKVEYRQNTPYEMILADDRARDEERERRETERQKPLTPEEKEKYWRDMFASIKNSI